MGAFGDAMRGANISSEIKENDEDLIAAVTKLKTIVDMYLGSYLNNTIEILVEPVDILQRKLSDIDNLVIHVIYMINYGDVIDEAKEMMECLISGEFDEVKGGVKVLYETSASKETPVLCLYSVFNSLNSVPIRDTLDEPLYDIISGIVNIGYTVSVPVSVRYYKTKCLYIHCGSPSEILTLNKYFRDNDIPAVEYNKSLNFKKYLFTFVPIMKKEQLGYNLPYLYVDSSSFVEQVSEQ